MLTSITNYCQTRQLAEQRWPLLCVCSRNVGSLILLRGIFEGSAQPRHGQSMERA